MRSSDGYTVVELLVATAVLFAATAGIFRLLDEGAARSTLWNESADLHQRGRVAVETFASILGSAGAGPDTGPLISFFAAVDPKRRTVGGPAPSAITVRYVPPHAPRSTLTAPLTPAVAIATIARHSGCPDGSTACGFVTDMDVVIFDGSGNWDTALVRSIASDALDLADRPGPRAVTYAAGAQVAQIVETTLYLDSTDDTLRREHPGASNLPLLDHVVDLQFEYFGDPSPPVAPKPAAGTANCLYDSNGTSLPLPTLMADHGDLVRLPLSMLGDGPMCGSGSMAYDVDLLRVRKIRVALSLQTGVATLRGRDPLLFARPGSAQASSRMLADLRLSLAFTPRNLQR
jgi:hypothetical protein